MGAGGFGGLANMGREGLPTAATAAVDIGYDYAWSEQLAWGARARLGYTGFSGTSDDVGRRTSLSETELSLAFHLGAF